MKNIKIKIFADINSIALENAVNEFIKDKDVVDIKYQSVSVVASNGMAINDRVMIIYKED